MSCFLNIRSGAVLPLLYGCRRLCTEVNHELTLFYYPLLVAYRIFSGHIAELKSAFCERLATIFMGYSLA